MASVAPGEPSGYLARTGKRCSKDLLKRCARPSVWNPSVNTASCGLRRHRQSPDSLRGSDFSASRKRRPSSPHRPRSSRGAELWRGGSEEARTSSERLVLGWERSTKSSNGSPCGTGLSGSRTVPLASPAPAFVEKGHAFRGVIRPCASRTDDGVTAVRRNPAHLSGQVVQARQTQPQRLTTGDASA